MAGIEAHVAEAEREAEALGISEAMTYEQFLEETGRDDSFVGSPDHGVPGTADVYEAAMRRLGVQPGAGGPMP